MVNFLEGLLTASGIECTVTHERRRSVLWVADDRRYEQARKIVTQALTARPVEDEPWFCTACGERIKGQFTDCWKCGGQRPG